MLSVGTRLGPYEILGPLGAGGMGEVSRARDTNLKREVALKVLPDAFAQDPDRLARFQREAMADAPPGVADIADPAERAIAARGRYIVMTAGCISCHATNGPQGPDLTKCLSGGAVKFQTSHGTYVSRNLTPDKDTGLARRTDDEVKRVCCAAARSRTVMSYRAP